jgi:ribosome maturation factor RimP
MKETELTLRDKLATLISAMGYEFVGCELNRSGGSSLLRIYIDTDKGVTVEDCSKVSRQVSAMLDVEDPIHGRYTLEVSSPGIDRPLFELHHYQKFIGSQIKVRVHTPMADRRNFVGVLLRVEEAKISLLVEEQELELAFSNIEKAKVIADVG